ncbi:uncharacterized protein [Venturia canescens]|uniref:uncharacterized protein isoform X2 n=2 Tax=Venturia canescens TaxID=32260 RepID=UPI001C9D16D7|nr:uncharacterized protein LOC122417875 isoform X2 [Venturia canescens]
MNLRRFGFARIPYLNYRCVVARRSHKTTRDNCVVASYGRTQHRRVAAKGWKLRGIMSMPFSAFSGATRVPQQGPGNSFSGKDMEHICLVRVYVFLTEVNFSTSFAFSNFHLQLDSIRYTGHCPTLKFRVGKRFGANTEEIMKELLEKKILKTGPYRPNSGKNAVLLPIVRDPEIRRDWKNEAHLYKTPPFVLGYTGYIPGYNNKYGLSFMRAVEEGGREWRETQTKLRLRRDAMRAHVDQRTTPRNMLSRARADNVEIEIDHGHPREPTFYENQVSPERPPIVGYTGHIPGAKGESALSRRYAQAARRGLQMLQREREGRSTRERDSSSGAQRAPNGRPYDET